MMTLSFSLSMLSSRHSLGSTPSLMQARTNLSRSAIIFLSKSITIDSMRYFAEKLGYGDEADFWATVGLLHDIDFEMWPEEHCKKAPELLKEGGVDDRMIHAIVSHGYGLCCDVKPEHEMEKVLFACDELTGLIGAAALMRPSKSCQDMVAGRRLRDNGTRDAEADHRPEFNRPGHSAFRDSLMHTNADGTKSRFTYSCCR